MEYEPHRVLRHQAEIVHGILRHRQQRNGQGEIFGSPERFGIGKYQGRYSGFSNGDASLPCGFFFGEYHEPIRITLGLRIPGPLAGNDIEPRGSFDGTEYFFRRIFRQIRSNFQDREICGLSFPIDDGNRIALAHPVEIGEHRRLSTYPTIVPGDYGGSRIAGFRSGSEPASVSILRGRIHMSVIRQSENFHLGIHPYPRYDDTSGNSEFDGNRSFCRPVGQRKNGIRICEKRKSRRRRYSEICHHADSPAERDRRVDTPLPSGQMGNYLHSPAKYRFKFRKKDSGNDTSDSSYTPVFGSFGTGTGTGAGVGTSGAGVGTSGAGRTITTAVS